MIYIEWSERLQHCTLIEPSEALLPSPRASGAARSRSLSQASMSRSLVRLYESSSSSDSCMREGSSFWFEAGIFRNACSFAADPEPICRRLRTIPCLFQAWSVQNLDLERLNLPILNIICGTSGEFIIFDFLPISPVQFDRSYKSIIVLIFPLAVVKGWI